MEKEPEKPTRLLWLVPIFMGLLGGILMYIAVKDQDQEKANDAMLISVLSSIAWAFVYGFIVYLGLLSSLGNMMKI